MCDLFKNIRNRRIAAGLTQGELADRVGYTDRSTISKIETGAIEPSLTKIKQIAEELGVSPSTLIGHTYLFKGLLKENDDLVTVIEKLENDSDLLRAALTLVNLPEPQRGAMVQMLLSLGAK